MDRAGFLGLLAVHPGRPRQGVGRVCDRTSDEEESELGCRRCPRPPGLLAKDGRSLANSEANTRPINIVENCFGEAGQPLTIPGRVLIGEGVLTKLCRKKPKARQFFLLNDILVYGNIVNQKKKYNKQHIIPLENVTIDSIKDEGDLRNGWLIKTPTKSFAVYAATATEKMKWMNHINKCVTDLLSKSGKTPSNEHAAVWVPDTEATVCVVRKQNLHLLIVVTIAGNAVLLSVNPALKRDFFFLASPLSLCGYVTSATTCFLLGTWPHASLLDQTPTVSH